MPLLFLEFLGTTELLVIMVVALVIFGPRRLPQLGQSIGKSLSEFKRASEDFKRTWEMEVSMEQSTKEARIEQAIAAPPEVEAPSSTTYARGSDVDENGDYHNDYHGDSTGSYDSFTAPAAEVSAAPSADQADAAVAASGSDSSTSAGSPRKQDWL